MMLAWNKFIVLVDVTIILVCLPKIFTLALNGFDDEFGQEKSLSPIYKFESWFVFKSFGFIASNYIHNR